MPSIAVANNSTTNMMVDARPVNLMDKIEAALNALIADQKTEAAKAAEAEPVDPVPADAEIGHVKRRKPLVNCL